ncbi:TPA: ATP-dependent helicase [Candidatus Berkelbacteria bacterium]|nr:ATP-dependent helicase [Candidatus Berkelbacteria bacterium]
MYQAYRPKSKFGGNNSNYNRNRFQGRPKRSFGESIDPNRFVQKATNFNIEIPTEIKNKFADFKFCQELNRNLQYKKYEIPTPIQDQSIEHIMNGRDIVGLANTGTGKTAAFLLPLINRAFLNKNERVLIIAPTRELANQISNEMHEFSFSMKVFQATCVGGMPMGKQIQSLRRNPNFVIGTPGRLKDLANKNFLKLETFHNIILDEVDRMLDMGFVDDISEILNLLPKDRQSLFFSATMPPKIRVLVDKFLVNPVTVQIKSRDTAENVDQDVVRCSKDQKLEKLHEILSKPETDKVLIFSETKRDVEKLTNDLIAKGFRADSIHGDKRQGQRQRSLNLFKTSQVKILVATDVAARGIDIKDISHVINYTQPQTYTDYIHRIGRTGRCGKTGIALTFVESR